MATSPDRPGVVIVGTGFGCLTHVPAFRAAGFEVVALVGRDPAKTRTRAERLGVPHATTELETALALPGVVAVSVATPPATHRELVLAAVAAGKHVLCEKPFALDPGQAAEMLAAAEAAGVVHLLGTEFRFSTPQALLRRIVRSGVLGEPRLAVFELEIPLLADPEGEIPAWWGSAVEGGGWLGAQGSHLVDQIRTTLGDFEVLSATLSTVSARDMTAEDSFTLHFRTAGGCTGIVHSSVATWGRIIMDTRIAGPLGTAWISGGDVWLADAAGKRKAPVPPDLENPAPVPPPADLLHTAYDFLHFSGIDLAPYTRLLEIFRSRISGVEGADEPRDPEPATFRDGLEAARLLASIREAARRPDR